MASRIITKKGSGAPLASDLVHGELAVDTVNKRLYTENASGVVIEVGTNPSTIDINAGTIDGTVIGGTTPAAVTTTALVATTADINAGTIDGTVIGGSTAAAITGTTITGTSFVSSGNMTFGDSDKAVFGASSDLQIYHDGLNSYIQDDGTGNLFIQASNVLWLRNATGTAYFSGTSGGETALYYNGSERLATTATGIDVTGTVTADKVTIGTSSASNGKLTLEGVDGSDSAGIYFNNTTATNGKSYSLSSGNSGEFMLYDRTSSAYRLFVSSAGNISFYEDTGTTAKFFWDASAESLGIGTSSPARALHVVGTGRPAEFGSDNVINYVKLYNSATGNGTYNGLDFLVNSTSNSQINAYGMPLTFGTSASNGTDVTERLRITSTGACEWRPNGTTQAMTLDASGNLLVGTTSAGGSNGITLHTSGYIQPRTNTGIPAIYADREGSDGSIVELRKDGATVGSIATIGGDMYIGTDDTNLRFNDSEDGIYPVTSAGGARDNAVDLGNAIARFDDIYATNGTIQTSDRNEKQDIEVLSEAEQRVAVVAKGLLRKFRWKDSVEEKGDDARIHFGIIAQDLQAAFEAEGLDAGRYAMFISTTWTDEETGEERSRMGVRYSELLAFIIAAI